MKFRSSLFSLSLLSVGAVACAPAPDDTDAATTDELAQACAGGPALVQAGAGLNVLGVVGDRYAIYQDGGQIYATRLAPGAARIPLTDATVAGAQVLVAGDVAVIWPDQAAFTPTTPTRMVVWSPWTGARVASTRSVAPTFTNYLPGVAVSPDGRRVLFIDNVDATATRGDLVYARTDLSDRRTIATGIDVDYATGACTPALGFTSAHGGARPYAAFCTADAPAAHLVTVDHGGAVRTLSDALYAPVRVYADDGELTTVRAGDFYPLSIEAATGATTVLDTNPTNIVFPTDDGPLAFARTAAGWTLQRLGGDAPEPIAPLPLATTYQGHAPLGQPYYTDPWLSPDGELALFPTTASPTTGLSDVALVDVSGGAATPVTLTADPACGTSFELFTRDSSYALYYCLDLATGVASLHAGSLDEPAHQLSVGATAFQHFATGGSELVFADNVAFTPTAVTFDLIAADAADPGATRTLVSAASTNFMVTADRRYVVYGRDADPALAGLYVTRAR